MHNPREAAVVALYKIEKEGAYLNKAILDNSKGLNPADRAFLNQLVMGVARNKTYIDFLIQKYSKIKLKKLSDWVHQILRCGVYQLVMMDKIPPSAACNESVKLANKFAHSGAKGYVNGVLRSISRSLDNLPETDDLAVRYSTPDWIVKKLIAQFGETKTKEILKDSLIPHPTMVRVNMMKTTPSELIKILEQEGISAEQGEEEPCLKILGAIDIGASDAYKNGLYTLQNINSMRAALVLSPKENEFIIDMCSAPGGKTTHIAELMNNNGKVVAFDIHEHKIDLINRTAKRLSINIIDARVNNSEIPIEELFGKADRVLCDVPCSGLGVIHKKPDIKWNRKEEDIAELLKIQKNILNSASKYVKSGGVLVYSTCTILREENEEQIEEFLKENTDFEKDFEKLYLAHETGGSGFYICRLRKK